MIPRRHRSIAAERACLRATWTRSSRLPVQDFRQKNAKVAKTNPEIENVRRSSPFWAHDLVDCPKRPRRSDCGGVGGSSADGLHMKREPNRPHRSRLAMFVDASSNSALQQEKDRRMIFKRPLRPVHGSQIVFWLACLTKLPVMFPS